MVLRLDLRLQGSALLSELGFIRLRLDPVLLTLHLRGLLMRAPALRVLFRGGLLMPDLVSYLGPLHISQSLPSGIGGLVGGYLGLFSLRTSRTVRPLCLLPPRT